jgi:hypothetical protein
MATMPTHRKTHVEVLPARLPDPWLPRQPELPGINQRVTPPASSFPVVLPPPLLPPRPARTKRLATVHDLKTMRPMTLEPTIHTQPTLPPPTEPYPPPEF